MKLYYHPGSANARKARMTAAVLGIELELVLVDIFQGAHKKPEYLAKNPNGMLPTLDDGGFLLWESDAICQYLATKKSTHDLLPSEPKAHADVVRWLCWDLAHWTPAVQSVVFERVFKQVAKLGPPDQAALNKGLANFARFAAVLNGHLEGKEHIAQNKLTLADVCIACQFTHAGAAGLSLDPYKHVQRWFGSIEKTDAWKKTVPAM